MPTYTCVAPAGLLDTPRKGAVAQAITAAHAHITGALSYFAQVIFQSFAAGDVFIGGRELSHAHIFVHGRIRDGRSAIDRKALIRRLAADVAAAAAVDPFRGLDLPLGATCGGDGRVRPGSPPSRRRSSLGGRFANRGPSPHGSLGVKRIGLADRPRGGADRDRVGRPRHRRRLRRPRLGHPRAADRRHRDRGRQRRRLPALAADVRQRAPPARPGERQRRGHQ